MECVELSDLEEGEILENENDSLSNFSESCSDEFGSVKNQYKLVGEYKQKIFLNKENKANGLLSSESNDYNNLSRKYKLSDRSHSKSNVNIIDLGLEEVSLDGDGLSDDDWKHSCGDLDYKIRKKKRPQYGTAEDIMSEIGETISRKKSHCSHKKRKAKYNFHKYKDNYNLWRNKASHVKSKKFRRKLDLGNFNSDALLTQRRKRKKWASNIIEESIKKPKIRDFDEMRQTLLEKLRKQKTEEANAKSENVIFVEDVENSEIQEVEMGIDNTNYVDNPDAGNPNKMNLFNETEKDKEENDDLDLIKLRLAALESNSKQKANSTSQKRVKNEEQTEDDYERSEDMNLDRYELLLRAEALKTALLKKHQKRLNKAKEMSNGANSSSNNNSLSTSLPLRGDSSNDEKPSTSSMSNSVTEGNTKRKVECQTKENMGKSIEDLKITTPLVPSLNLKKAKSKRRKRKSESLHDAKENTENTEVLEEDDRTLRSQLLRDLLRKKSLKDMDKKTVLTDSVQTSVNQLCVSSNEPLKEKRRCLAAASKKNLSEKVDVVNATKPLAVPRIPKSEIKRIIVHLGSEDSSDENDMEENSFLESKEIKEKNTATKESNECIQANYEKSVDLLLSQTWQKIEGEIAAAKNVNNTPEAVYKHLPLSQRLEYIRLKQKIAERERLKMKGNFEKQSSGSPGSHQDSTPHGKTFLSNPVPPKNSATVPLKSEYYKPAVNLQESGAVSKNVPLNFKNVTNPKEVNAKQKTVAISNVNAVKNARNYVAPLNGLNVSQTSQRRSLLQSSQALISKLKILLKKIKIDKTIEENYEKEISKLKNQINLFEKKKVEQKMKIKKLAEESLKTYKLIQQITSLAKKPKEETKEKKDCIDLATKNERVVKVSEEAKSEKIMNVPEESKNDISKVKAEEEVKESENVSLPTVGPLDYNSPLIAFSKISDDSDRVDPNVMICQFDLMGICKDEECTYQHFKNLQSLQCDLVSRSPIQEEKDVSK